MRVTALFLLLATSASAQPADSTLTTPRRDYVHTTLLSAGAAGGILAVWAGGHLIRRVGDSDGDGALVLYPVGVVAGVYGVGRSQGWEGTLPNTVARTAVGTLVGIAGGTALIYAGFEVGGGLFAVEESPLAIGMILSGFAFMAVAPPYVAARSFHAADVVPVVLAGPDGERTAGLSLRIGL